MAASMKLPRRKLPYSRLLPPRCTDLCTTVPSTCVHSRPSLTLYCESSLSKPFPAADTHPGPAESPPVERYRGH